MKKLIYFSISLFVIYVWILVETASKTLSKIEVVFAGIIAIYIILRAFSLFLFFVDIIFTTKEKKVNFQTWK